ncbi:oxidoreductase [Mycolicibacterium cyprinidarum]|uniref:Oxidoreductase n=1 Tax=Mycolicibacterium cyprinidarum TaxID=2860311 RepID=A0ABQ4V6E3_9MYCO|nr:oxidoreductase [Mycolicibacterium sp. NGTWS0302]GJF10678.1 oxidoreductase [Mycolicibacterium sp. NGTWSNA01]GJF18366.1 oxidoreductase [Mycolicibacterium sp. NGTWS1803]
MIRNFEGKVAVITGAANGIGRALALGFAAEGMQVVAADIDESGAMETVARIGSGAVARRVDVSDAESVATLADGCFTEFGHVDLLVNNAGVFQGGLSWERSIQDWEWTLGVNVYGIIHGIRSFVPRMMAQDTDGHVLNTASVAAFVSAPASAPYVVSKCAALALSECLAHDLAAVGSKIGASVLTPSSFDTGIAQTAGVRPERFGTDDTADGKGTAEALATMLLAGMAPDAAVKPVLDAIRSGEFLIPTRPSYSEQIHNRYDSLLARKLPPLVAVD